MNRAERLRIPAQIAIAALVAYLIGFRFTSLFPDYLPRIGGLWSAIGALTSGLYLVLHPFDPFGMALVIFVTVLICSAFNVSSHARLAAITVIVVMVTASLDPKLNPLLNALLRFLESCIGSGVALLAVWLWPGTPSKPESGT
jgi:uncharacterized membrane protein YccC